MSLAIEIILVLVSVVMIVSVLMQKSKSAGLGAAYGSDTETFGVKVVMEHVKTRMGLETCFVDLPLGL